jgi:hypothetical protein
MTTGISRRSNDVEPEGAILSDYQWHRHYAGAARTVLDLTNTEIWVAETRVSQARTEAVRRELSQNAANGRARAEAIETAIRDLGGLPDVVGPLLGRAAAAAKR